MKTLLIGLVAIFSIGANFANAGTLINLEEAAEVSRLEIRLSGSAAGRIYARICDNCELLTLRADSNTRIERSGTRLNLEQAAALKNKGATVLFNPTTLQITRIIYWN